MTKSYADLCIERAEKATPGPWEQCLGSGGIECTAIHFEGNHENPFGLFVCDLLPDYLLDSKYEKDISYKEANMEFISRSRTDVAELAKRLKRASEEFRKMAELWQKEDAIELAIYCNSLADELERVPE